MSKTSIPRGPGIPPLNDAAFEQAFAMTDPSSSTSSSSSATYTDDGRINPLAGMGLTDEQYQQILQGLVQSESFAGVDIPEDLQFLGGKRALTMEDDDERGSDAKRGRFELVE
jgi:osomolarity two-component system response regulator SKN7